MVFMNVVLTGTSNSTTTSITLPILPNTTHGTMNYSVDNGFGQIGSLFINPGQAILSFWRFSSINVLTSSWTASGIKTITGQFFYEI
jgi:hypothetical protein